MLLRARILVPVTVPPVEDGGVLLRSGRIAAAGRWSDVRRAAPAEPVQDLGDAVLLPGLVNAHAHLEYTHLAGRLRGDGGFARWAGEISALRGSPAEAAVAWEAGAAQLLATGTTTVADHATVRPGLAVGWEQASLRVLPMIEMTGVISRRPPGELLAEAEALLESSPWPGGFAPHAPYSTVPALLAETARRSAHNGRRVSLHVAESTEEFDLFVHRRGPLRDWIAALGRDLADCDGRTPLEHVARHGLLNERLLLVHANCLTDGDVDLLAPSGASVVHCPGSHAFFGHPPFRFETLVGRGVNVCLGTDSLATMPAGPDGQAVLDLFAELRRFRQAHPATAPDAVLQLATTNAARALGCGGQVGCLQPGARADLVVVAGGMRAGEVEEALVQGACPVLGVMTGGVWRRQPA